MTREMLAERSNCRLLLNCVMRLNARPALVVERRYKNTLKVNRIGRSGSYGPLPGNDRHFRVAMEKMFTRKENSEFGIETGLEDMQILTYTRGQNVYRRLNDKKKKQLIELYTNHICSLIAVEVSLAKYAVEVTKVELPNVLHEVLVYWRCFGDERDDKLITLFAEHGNKIWRQLAEIFGESTPPLRFVGDRRELHVNEMNRLFELADYGMSYRAVSKAGSILGSMREAAASSADGNEALDEKAAKVPRWVVDRERRRRLRELKAADSESDSSREAPSSDSNKEDPAKKNSS